MDKRRYDDVVKLIASVVFGSSFRQFHELIKSLENNFNCTPFWAVGTTIVFFSVFFRNVHGLIAYDLWAEHSKYKPSFEQRPRRIVINFTFGLLGAIFLPYLFIYLLTGHTEGKSACSNPWLVSLFLFSPVILYIPWNIYWLRLLRRYGLYSLTKYRRPFPPNEYLPWMSSIRNWILKLSKVFLDCMQPFGIIPLGLPKSADEPEGASKYIAYVQILDFTILWCFLDCLFIGMFFVEVWYSEPYYVPDFCKLYVVIVPIILILDYLSHVEYYFPTPMPPQEFYEFGKIWGYVLPDGIKFCHWGGKSASAELVDALNITDGDKVLELCCGQGGALDLLPANCEIYGVDKSPMALVAAKRTIRNKRVTLLCADAFDLQLPNDQFTKIFSQDGDAWMCGDKDALMREIFRVTAKGGIFVYQSYARTNSITEAAQAKMAMLLREVGYQESDVPLIEGLEPLFKKAGFQILAIVDLHDLYLQDNLRMIELCAKNRDEMLKKFSEHEVFCLERLLLWEKELFANRWWSGVRVVARKD